MMQHILNIFHQYDILHHRQRLSDNAYVLEIKGFLSTTQIQDLERMRYKLFTLKALRKDVMEVVIKEEILE